MDITVDVTYRGVYVTRANERRAHVPAGFTAVNVAPEAADDLRTFAALAGGALGKRVTLSNALRLATRIATAHLTADATAAARQLGLIEPAAEQ
jgi:hypothetical protein